MRSLAFVHDWITGLRGGERCLLAFLLLYPKAKIYSLFYKQGSSHKLIDQNFTEASILNSIPSANKYYKLLLPLYPLIRFLKTDKNADILSLSHAASKNIRKTDKAAVHICYCFTPMRYIWDQVDVYLGWKRFIVWPFIAVLRVWDRSCSKEVDYFVSISNFVSARIRRFYGRKSAVVYPPVAKLWIDPTYATKPESLDIDQSYFLFASALVPYKGADVALQACKNLQLPLYVAGSGPELASLKQQASDDIKFLGKVSDSELAYLLLNCRALIFPCKEDFGILPIEALFAGKPVIALHAGACKETIAGFKHWDTAQTKTDFAGVFIRNSKNRQQLIENTEAALNAFLKLESEFSAEYCKLSAERFSAGSFYDNWKQFIQSVNSSNLLKMPNKAEFVEKFERLRF